MDNEAGNPPIPWIGKQAQALAESSHPWKLSQDHQAIIGIRYYGAAGDHQRCRFFLLFPRAGFWLAIIASINIMRGTINGLVLIAMLPSTGTVNNNPSTALNIALMTGYEVLEGIVFSLIGLTLIHWVVAWVSLRNKVVGEASDVLLTTQGIVSLMNGKSIEIPWRQMRSVNEIVGDLLFVGKTLEQGFIFRVPLSPARNPRKPFVTPQSLYGKQTVTPISSRLKSIRNFPTGLARNE